MFTPHRGGDLGTNTVVLTCQAQAQAQAQMGTLQKMRQQHTNRIKQIYHVQNNTNTQHKQTKKRRLNQSTPQTSAYKLSRATWTEGRKHREEEVRKWTRQDQLLTYPHQFTPQTPLSLPGTHIQYPQGIQSIQPQRKKKRNCFVIQIKIQEKEDKIRKAGGQRG